MSYKGNTDEILNYAVEYLTRCYGIEDSISNRKNYIKVIAHLMSKHNLSYKTISVHWPKFYLRDLIPQFKIAFRGWLSTSKISEINEYTKTLIEIMSDRIIADIIYNNYLKHLKSGDN